MTSMHAGAFLIKYGVINVVAADTKTTIGYSESPVTPRLMPRDAMIKANSPIWARVKPHFRAFSRVWPDRSMPRLENPNCPTIATRAITMTGIAFSESICGFTIIPTEMK